MFHVGKRYIMPPCGFVWYGISDIRRDPEPFRDGGLCFFYFCGKNERDNNNTWWVAWVRTIR